MISTFQSLPSIYFEEISCVYGTNKEEIYKLILPGAPYPTIIQQIELPGVKDYDDNPFWKKYPKLWKHPIHISIGLTIEPELETFYVFDKKFPYLSLKASNEHVLASFLRKDFKSPIIHKAWGGKVKGLLNNQRYKNQLYVDSIHKVTSRFDPTHLLMILQMEFRRINLSLKFPEKTEIKNLFFKLKPFKFDGTTKEYR